VAYRSGPGRKWLVLIAAGAFWAVTFAVTAARGVGATPLQLGRALFALGFLLAAARAARCGVVVDHDLLEVRLWAATHRLHLLDDVAAVEVALVDPTLQLHDGRTLRLLDCWHEDPGGVAAEVRQRWEAQRHRRDESESPSAAGPFG